ncbi:hypothetical protein FYK55_26175 [Roseiconus nitratireducens]|uniref:Uncharacterized protein n=1 Tax=Roseiconus nitratireducens TaxID=2605748 RepID=A0A5M6CVF8_9BACT|nr:hypothetical protein [Roseiconus nitratireducens]KAA5538926.1 hypothetical protein FYK55_26175 [Roseiconus nitratireducens]
MKVSIRSLLVVTILVAISCAIGIAVHHDVLLAAFLSVVIALPLFYKASTFFISPRTGAMALPTILAFALDAVAWDGFELTRQPMAALLVTVILILAWSLQLILVRAVRCLRSDRIFEACLYASIGELLALLRTGTNGGYENEHREPRDAPKNGS